MRRRYIKILTVLAAAACLAALPFVLSACKKETDSSYEIKGLRSIHLKIDQTEYDFLSGVSGFKDGNPHEITVDASKVKFGSAGKYTAAYTCGTLKTAVHVWVYGLPSMSAANTELSYTDAFYGATDGVEAADYFGTPLSVRFVSAADAHPVYTFQYGGTYTAEYAATDAAGQTVTKTRRLSVSTDDSQRPVFAPVTTDLSFVNFAVDLQGGALERVYDQNGDLADEVSENGGRAVGFGLALGRLGGTGTRSFTIVTSKGYGELKVTVTDTKEPAVEYAFKNAADGMDGYIFREGENVDFPGLEPKFGCFQNLSFTEELTKNGVPVSGVTDEGVYVYTVTVTKGGVSYPYTQTVAVLNEDNYTANANNTLSDQFLDRFFPVKKVDQTLLGSSVEYAGAVTDAGGVTKRAVLFDNKADRLSLWSSLGISPGVLRNAIESGYTSLELDALLPEDSGVPENTPLRVSFLFYVGGQFGESPEGAILYSNPEYRYWQHLSVRLPDLRAGNPSGLIMYTLDADGSFVSRFTDFAVLTCARTEPAPHKVYLSNIRFAGKITADVTQFMTDNHITEIGGSNDMRMENAVDRNEIPYSGLTMIKGMSQTVINIKTSDINAAVAAGYNKIRFRFVNIGASIYLHLKVNGELAHEQNFGMWGDYIHELDFDIASGWQSFTCEIYFDVRLESITFEGLLTPEVKAFMATNKIVSFGLDPVIGYDAAAEVGGNNYAALELQRTIAALQVNISPAAIDEAIDGGYSKIKFTFSNRGSIFSPNIEYWADGAAVNGAGPFWDTDTLLTAEYDIESGWSNFGFRTYFDICLISVTFSGYVSPAQRSFMATNHIIGFGLNPVIEYDASALVGGNNYAALELQRTVAALQVNIDIEAAINGGFSRIKFTFSNRGSIFSPNIEYWADGAAVNGAGPFNVTDTLLTAEYDIDPDWSSFGFRTYFDICLISVTFIP